MAKVAVLGYGTVGSGVVEVLDTNAAEIEKSAESRRISRFRDNVLLALIVVVIIGVLILKEPLSWQQLVGGLLILGFTLLNELDTGK